MAALAAGCASHVFSETKIDSSSPVAPEVARVARANTDYPSFKEIPAPPKDVRPLRLYGQAAREIDSARADLEANTGPGAWTLGDTDAFAAGARRAAGSEAAPASSRGTEAFAEDARQRATPPPPPRK
jgi:hypothetical protein